MAKIVMTFFAAVACIQLIKPLGWPGLKYRRDAWKLALAGFAVTVLLLAIRPFPDTEISAPEQADEQGRSGGGAR